MAKHEPSWDDLWLRSEARAAIPVFLVLGIVYGVAAGWPKGLVALGFCALVALGSYVWARMSERHLLPKKFEKIEQDRKERERLRRDAHDS
jgi:hypothetical protein